MNKTENRSKGKIRRAAVSVVAGVMMMTTAASFNAYACCNEHTSFNIGANYNGFPIIHDFDDNDIEFRYSDGFFLTDPTEFDPHLATMSDIMANASSTYVENGDWSNGGKTIMDLLEKCKFEFVEVSDTYLVKPTTDSIACAIGSKDIETAGGLEKVVSITIRSANYDSEWSSNVTLGTEGEAKGFADSADRVMRYLSSYLGEHPDIADRLEEGKANIWLQGFSRGGAVANLTAKRLIDKYQDKGNEVYAYCLEAPQGGIAEMERSDRDYSSIHNIIDPNDLVTYVAPSAMGFKRYGVDHYVDSIPKDKVMEQLTQIVGNDRAGSYAPAASKNKELSLSGITDGDEIPSSVIIKNALDVFTSNISREEYVNSGLQDALRNILHYMNDGGDLGVIFNNINVGDILLNVFTSMIINYSPAGITVNTVEYIWDTITGKDDKTDIIASPKDIMIESLIHYMQSTPQISGQLDPSLIKDISTALRIVLKNIDMSIDNMTSGDSEIGRLMIFGLNLDNIFQNHQMIQTMGYLRANDSWYNMSPFLGSDDPTYMNIPKGLLGT